MMEGKDGVAKRRVKGRGDIRERREEEKGGSREEWRGGAVGIRTEKRRREANRGEK